MSNTAQPHHLRRPWLERTWRSGRLGVFGDHRPQPAPDTQCHDVLFAARQPPDGRQQRAHLVLTDGYSAAFFGAAGIAVVGALLAAALLRVAKPATAAPDAASDDLPVAA